MPINYTEELAAAIKTDFFKMMDYAAQNSLKPEMDMVNRCTDFIPVKDRIADLGWYGSIAGMRKWDGNRKETGIVKYDYVVGAEPYELTVSATRRMLENYDKHGELARKLKGIATKGVLKKVQLFSELLESGFATNCYDSQPYYDDNHVDPGAKYTTVQDNLGTGALTDAALTSARLAMSQYKDDNGDPAGSKPDLLIVPRALEGAAKVILETEGKPGGSNNDVNINRGVVDLWVFDYLTSDKDWYLMDTRDIIGKPFVITVPQDDLFLTDTGERARFDNKYRFGIDSELGLGFANWRTTYGVNVP